MHPERARLTGTDRARLLYASPVRPVGGEEQELPDGAYATTVSTSLKIMLAGG